MKPHESSSSAASSAETASSWFDVKIFMAAPFDAASDTTITIGGYQPR